MSRFNPRMISALRSAYGHLERISVEHFDRMKQALGHNPDNDALRQLADSDIRFINTAARSVLCDRGVITPDEKFQAAIDLILQKAASAASA